MFLGATNDFNSPSWNFETHKVNDPAYVVPKGVAMAYDITTTEPAETLAVQWYVRSTGVRCQTDLTRRCRKEHFEATWIPLVRLDSREGATP